MSRPKKCRRICCLPKNERFGPLNGCQEMECVEMSVDEYEVIRLIDLSGFTQEECARQMEIARTTVQMIYDLARRKLADALVNGRQLVIHGGEYALCPHAEECFGINCKKQRCKKGIAVKKMEETDMRIAVTFEEGQVFQHFGKSKQFKVYEVNEGKVVSAEVVDTEGSGHSALADFLREQGVDTLICGGIGGCAQTALAEAGISLYPGVSGDADSKVAELLLGNLNYNPDAQCSDHAHHEGGEGCGHHCSGHQE